MRIQDIDPSRLGLRVWFLIGLAAQLIVYSPFYPLRIPINSFSPLLVAGGFILIGGLARFRSKGVLQKASIVPLGAGLGAAAAFAIAMVFHLLVM